MIAIAVLLAAATPQAASPSPAPDYARPESWLCRPGRADACAQDLTTTVVAAGGRRTTERYRPAAKPGFDCFYVYPTVSRDASPNSDMTAGPEERQVIQFQAARFGQVCRVFAPLYRQVTLTALRGAMTGQPVAVDRAMAYADVKGAWDAYIARDNGGRGVVLIGHSQGSGILKQLIAQEIEGTPVARRVISAMIPGTNVAVPAGQDVGGDLKAMPLCRRADQFGCVVAYVSFRADQPPPADTRFGTVAGAGLLAACTNPAALGGGRATLRSYFGSQGAGTSAGAAPVWSRTGGAVTTPFVATPGLISAECVTRDGARYLAVTTNAVPADPRTDDVGGDVQAGSAVLKDWGLHLIDVNLAMGDLVALAGRQAAAWRKAQRRDR